MDPHQSLPERASPEWFEALNRAILDSALDCIITMDATGRVIEFNPAAEKIFGYTRAAAVGKELAELIVPPALRDRHRKGLRHYLETGEGPVLGRRIEIAAVRADGAEILVELAITAFRIENVPVFTAYLRDITERVRTERRRTAQYTVASLLAGSWSLAEAGSQIIQTVAASGHWVFGSLWIQEDRGARLHCETTWHTLSAALTRFEEISRALILSPNEGLPGRVLKTKKPTWIADIVRDKNFPRKAAAQAAELRSAFAFPLCAEGEVKGVIELFSPAAVQPDEDLLQLVESLGSQIGLFIHRRETEKELERQKEAAESANAAKDRFLATLSHELRTPLNPILIWAGGMVNQPGLTPELEEGLRMICRNVELEARLIDDLLDLTRIARGKLSLQLRPADAHELLQHALDIVQSGQEPRAVKLSTRFEAARHHLRVDAPRIQQVFWNVLQNAYKFSTEPGEITVRTSNPTPDRFVVEIEDHGIGIEPESLARIFDAFDQGDTVREGLGLGLAISKAIVKMHGGEIHASSVGRGQGATFTIELPLEAQRDA